MGTSGKIMSLFNRFHGEVLDSIHLLQADGGLPVDVDSTRVTVESPRETSHGDMTTNAAMVLASQAGMKPRDLAELIKAHLEEADAIREVEIAGPGFINMRLDDSVWHEELANVLRAGTAYGDSDAGNGQAVNVEYVSANPTGPLHVGHGRGAVVGDALASLLAKAGYTVSREYYVNDAGAQVEKLAYAAYWRYLEALGKEVSPEVIDGFLHDTDLEYRGDYLVPVGERLAREHGTDLVGQETEDWLPAVRAVVVDAMMDLVREDLSALGVEFDCFTSERDLVNAGKVDDALAFLEERGLVYTGVLEPPKGKIPEEWESRPQTLFRATQFGDDVDRPLKKSDGSWTYFAPDIAYHRDKFQRGFKLMINVWGADHGGYVKRMQAAVKAMTDGEGDLDVKVCRLVNLLDGGKPVKMSKRAGTFVTLREVIDQVGKDVVRFIMLTRTNDKTLDFDFAKVTEKTRDNPVFYVQYAHARARSVMRHAAEIMSPAELTPEALAAAPLHRLTDSAELDLIRGMANWPRLVETAAEVHEPHRVAYYLNDLAAQFHALWNKGNDDASLRFIREDDLPLSTARLALVQGMATVIASGLKVFGVTPVEEMR
jgi:arginyl-tRNA synthetase